MQVDRIDHVYIEVRDRDAAAAWYDRVLGLVRHDGMSEWADHPTGPLILATADGTAALSLFARDPKPVSRDATIAFRVGGRQFLDFLGGLPDTEIRHRSGRPLDAGDAVDHDLSWSLYFLDPDGNWLGLTTYDHDEVADTIRAS